MNEQTEGGVTVARPPNYHQHLDWLEITYPLLGEIMPSIYPPGWPTSNVEARPTNGYTEARRYADGRIEMFSPDNRRMGIHVLMTAETLKTMNIDDHKLLEFFITNGAKVTRIDFALDVFEKPLDFDALWLMAKSGDYECRLRKPPIRTMDAGHGDTIYFGRMKSSVFTRVYNKAVEQNYDGSWVRVETVMRHSRANNAAKLMVRRKLDASQLIRGHVNLPRLEWWTDVMTVKAEKTRYDRSDGSQRLSWLMKSVAPTLAKEMYLNPEVWNTFKQTVFDKLNDLRQVGDM
jgi:hypothetical protein